MNILIKQFKENGLDQEIKVRKQRSHRFPKQENCSFLAFQQKGDQMKNFWKPEILERVESNIFCVKSGALHVAAIENCQRPLFVEYEAYPYILAQKWSPKCAQNTCG